MRITIKPHNQAYITNLAESLGCSNAEALNYLLLKIKSEGIAATPIQKAAVDSVIGFDVQPIREGFESFNNVMDSQHLQEQIDPMIERLISLGVCTEGF
jgi:hypothetical protein